MEAMEAMRMAKIMNALESEELLKMLLVLHPKDVKETASDLRKNTSVLNGLDGKIFIKEDSDEQLMSTLNELKAMQGVR